MEQKSFRIKIIGPVPPPIGGISVHTERLALNLQLKGYDVEMLEDDLIPGPVLFKKILLFVQGKGYKRTEEAKYCTDFKSFKRLRGFFSVVKSIITEKEKCIYHLHKKYWKYRALASLAGKLSRNAKIVITFHSMRENLSELGLINRFYVFIVCRFGDAFIVTNSDIEGKLLRAGVSKHKIFISNPFLPPVEKKEEIDSVLRELGTFPEDHYPIVCGNASKLVFHNNEDLYGLDLLVEACAILKNEYRKIGFIFSLPEIGEENYFSKIKLRIEELNISDSFLIITKKIPFYPVLKSGNIFVRPTNTDGDSVSLREALHYGMPTVASDAVPRPEGTILFRNRDLQSMVSAIRGAFSNDLQELRTGETDPLENIITIYKKAGAVQ